MNLIEGQSAKQIWCSNENILLLNPKLSIETKNSLSRLYEFVNGSFTKHVLLTTSGSTSSTPRLVLLSKEAILSGAQAVNEFIGVSEEDRWLNSLPHFHIGGLAIHARSYLAALPSPVGLEKWNPHLFVELLSENKITLSSLVPTQLFDLVSLGLKAPACLRAVFVGGDRLSGELQEKSEALGWPILPTYGMTEASSQVATAERTDPKLRLRLLPHLDARIEEGFLAIRGSSLLTGYAQLESGRPEFNDPKIDGWFRTSDRANLPDSSNLPDRANLLDSSNSTVPPPVIVEILGRKQELLRVGAEWVELSKLGAKLRQTWPYDQVPLLIGAPNERLGHQVVLVVEGEWNLEIRAYVTNWNKTVMPYERIAGLYFVQNIPRTALGKVNHPNLMGMLGF